MKNSINENNYLWFLFEYLEGNLNEEEKKEVEKYLLLNPDLQREFDLLSLTVLRKNEEIKLKEKEILKFKDDDKYYATNNYELLSIKYIENELDFEEKKKFEIEIEKNEELKKCYELYKLTKLTPDTNIKFREKRILKKNKENTTIIYARWAIVLSAAACFMLLFILKNINKLIIYDNSSKYKNEINLLSNKSINKVINETSIIQNKSEEFDITLKSKRHIEKVESIKYSEDKFFDSSVLKRKSDYITENFQTITVNNIDITKPEISFSKQNPYLNTGIKYKYKSLNFLTELWYKSFGKLNKIEEVNTMTILKTSLAGINMITEANIKFSIDTIYDENLVKMRIETKSFAFMRTKNIE